jgi:ABC-type Mn2+/Zn2+ transport system ATPase subunit
MKEILTNSFLSICDEPIDAIEQISNKEFYSILIMTVSVLSIFGMIVHLF